ncbi:MAG TPA: cold shock domain-containing protein [Candidatus Dormibacteraeota bacterium]|nr:cold shock domain-containing protein [Candidatus Dormibacteraeota bacterium]
MEVPLRISYRSLDRSQALDDLIRDEAARLEEFYKPVISCHVAVEVPHRHRQRGNRVHVRIDLVVPGEELVINQQPSVFDTIKQTEAIDVAKEAQVGPDYRDAHLAVRDAFRKAARALEDYARRQRGDVKVHAPSPEGRVSKLFPDKGFGFIETPDGREVYFNRKSVLNDAFDRLAIGTAVGFAEERGEKGPQASTVRLLGKHVLEVGPEPAG